LADIFEETISITNKPKEVSNWLMGDTMKLLKSEEKSVEDISFSPKNLARLIDIIDEGKINRTMAKEVFENIFKDDVDPDKYIEEHDMGMVSDDGALKTTIEEIVANNPQSVADYKGGKTKAMGFLVGQTMKAMKGKADPASVNKILKEILDNM
jgi:aspartyl-tRNA(Asn)/glutamyl-tRNA(Gln) amidotransferase subunit B